MGRNFKTNQETKFGIFCPLTLDKEKNTTYNPRFKEVCPPRDYRRQGARRGEDAINWREGIRKIQAKRARGERGVQQKNQLAVAMAKMKYDRLVRRVLEEFGRAIGMRHHKAVERDDGTWVLVLDGGTGCYRVLLVLLEEKGILQPAHFLVECGCQRILSNTGPINTLSRLEAEKSLKDTLLRAFRIGFL